MGRFILSSSARSSAALAHAFVLATAVSAYQWPNPKLDVLEGMRWDQLGYNSFETALFVTPCDRYTFPSDKGVKNVRTNAADWLRTAYHDMATHNVETGVGGLDASIRFWQEQARPENPGNGFNNSVGFIAGGLNRYFSLSDGLALLAVVAVENCGGLSMSYRGGRIDALEPNDAGVPEPDQDIDSHTAAFARQGFNQTEMIGLVACGHTFGSVQSSNFPDVVAVNETDPKVDTGATFDDSIATFDHHVAVEYVRGTTKNPLVVGLNVTKNSDARIFASDKNATMQGFAQNAGHFQRTCKSLLERMIDTVPKGVELTEVIRPLPVKPYQVKLTYMNDGIIKLSGEVRFFNATANPQRAVTLAWKDSVPDASEISTVTLPHTDKMVSTALAGRVQSQWYGNQTFLAMLDASRGFGEFWFEVSEGDGAEPRAKNQDGRGFRLPTDKVMIAEGTCHYTVNIAVHESLHARSAKIFIELDATTPDNQATAPPEVVTLSPKADVSDANGYVIYTTTLVELQWSKGYGIVAEVDGQRLELPHSERNQFCPS
ncbi:heme peroxidase [Auriculariales sp. MPI-PUGE-AT-0066]|nr:heme peroxidase [Auriculariales sp. MPI-PUGE-AT-0066]